MTPARTSHTLLLRHSRLLLASCLVMALGFFLFQACNQPLDISDAKKLQDAQERFNRAQSEDDFLQAASIYESLVDKGIRSGALFYNLGNAYMQAGQRGRAIAAYRQARRYLPRDPFLEANLAYALGENSDLKSRKRLLDHLLFWKEWLSYPEKYQLLTVFAGLSLALALMALLVRASSRTWWKRGLVLMLLLTVLLGFSAGYDTVRFDRVKHGVITDDGVIARKGNSESYEPSFTQALDEGVEFKVIESRAEWLLIHLKGGLEGWIPASNAVTY